MGWPDAVDMTRFTWPGDVAQDERRAGGGRLDVLARDPPRAAQRVLAGLQRRGRGIGPLAVDQRLRRDEVVCAALGAVVGLLGLVDRSDGPALMALDHGRGAPRSGTPSSRRISSSVCW